MASLTINKLEKEIYNFVDGVMPTLVDIKEGQLGWKIRFRGCSLQKDSILTDGVNHNECWVNVQRSKLIYQYPIKIDGSVEQETEFTYQITLESKQTNFLLNSAATYAAKLTAHREGYELFNVAGVSKIEIISEFVRPQKNNSVFIINLLLKLRAVIILSDIKTYGYMNSGKVEIYESEKKVYEINI
jgi:hypothetical protein